MADLIEIEPRDTVTTDRPLLMREWLRRRQDRTFVNWLLSLLDQYLLLGYWWYPRLTYERRYEEDGFVWYRAEVRRTLAGHLISWGLATTWYKDGCLMSQEVVWETAFSNGCRYTHGEYWLPGNVKASLREWLTFVLGYEIPDDAMEFVWKRFRSKECCN